MHSFCMCAYVLRCFSHVQLFATLWTVAHQALCPWTSPGKNTRVGCHSRSSWPRVQTRVSCIAGGFFTIWATRQALSSPLFNDLESTCLSSEVWLISELYDHSCPSLSQDFKAEGTYVASPFLIPLCVCLSFSKNGAGCLEPHGLVGRLGIGFHGGWGMGHGRRAEVFLPTSWWHLSFRAPHVPGFLPRP